jgi:hypothetical protein
MESVLTYKSEYQDVDLATDLMPKTETNVDEGNALVRDGRLGGVYQA